MKLTSILFIGYQDTNGNMRNIIWHLHWITENQLATSGIKDMGVQKNNMSLIEFEALAHVLPYIYKVNYLFPMLNMKGHIAN